jgi:CTP:molybdopterin cytidylyltransferase MocA
VLAAGSGKRFGGPKAPFVYEGERLVDRAVRLLRDADLDPVVVILGAWEGAVPNSDVVVNPNYESGMGSSLAVGIKYLQAHYSESPGAIITLVDLPTLKRTTIDLVRDHPGSLVQAHFSDQPGHPVKIDRSHWEALLSELTGDSGAKEYLSRHKVVELDSDDPGAVADLDISPN